MVSSGGSELMNNNENNEVLSFEELRKKLGMDEPQEKKTQPKINAETKTPIIGDDIFAEIEQKLDEEVVVENTESKEIVENGKTFVDITDQYVKKEISYEVEQTVQKEEPKKKKVRTFNEIFADFFKKIIPQKKDSTREKIRKIVADISVVAIVCVIFAYADYFVERQIQLKESEEIKGYIVVTDDFDDNQYIEAWREVFAQYPNIQFPENMNLKYSYLYAVNQDLVGWIKIDNTNLDVQVVQSKDNEYYLNKDFYGKTSRYGCPYLDYKNDPQYLDDNTVIYGHHISDGLMFSNLDKYKTLEGYKESPIIEYNTLYETYYFKIFAAFITNADTVDDNGNFFNFTVTDFLTDEKFNSFVDEVEKRSLIKTDVNVQPDDKLITLMTCSYEFDSARLVVMGRALRENEEPVVDVESATLNVSPKYPQAWYDAKNIDNPFANDTTWS